MAGYTQAPSHYLNHGWPSAACINIWGHISAEYRNLIALTASCAENSHIFLGSVHIEDQNAEKSTTCNHEFVVIFFIYVRVALVFPLCDSLINPRPAHSSYAPFTAHVIVADGDARAPNRRLAISNHHADPMMAIVLFVSYFAICKYRKTSSMSRTKSQNLNASCIVLRLSSLNPLKPGVNLRMKM